VRQEKSLIDPFDLSYNASTFDTTWTMASAISADHLTLALGCEAAPPVISI
jgi:hypothetical protein